MTPSTDQGKYAYNAFISYSHEVDGQLAPAVQRALHRFAKPWYRMRALRIFRDTTNLSVSPQLWPEIEKALNSAEYLVLFASPQAARSKWVEKELTHWLDTRSSDYLLLVLTDGAIVWDSQLRDFDWTATNVLPACAKGRISSEPLYVDLSWAKRAESHLSLDHPDFAEAIHTLAAKLHGVAKDIIAGEEVKQQKRTRRLAWSAVFVVLTLAIATGLAAYNYNVERKRALTARETAEEQRNVALSRQLAAQGLVIAQQPNEFNGGQDRALLLALEATNVSNSAELRGNLLRVLQLNAQLTKTFWGRDRRLSAIAYAPDGQVIAAAGSDGTVHVWEVETGLGRHSFAQTRALLGALVGKVPSEQADSLGLGPRDGVLVLEVSEGRPADAAGIKAGDILDKVNGRTIELGTFPDGLPPGEDAQIGIIRHGEHVTMTARLGAVKEPGHEGRVEDIAFSPDGQTLASAGLDGTIRLWSIQTGAQLGEPLKGHGEGVLAIDFSPDGKTLATGGQDETVRLWNVATRTPRGEPLVGHTGPVLDVAFSPDGKIIVSAGEDKTVRMWNVDTRAPRGEPLLGHEDPRFGLKEGKIDLIVEGQVLGVAFNADGSIVASAGADGSIRLWDVATQTALGEPLRGHRSWVYAVAFHPDDHILASAGWDGTVRLWDLSTHEPIGEPLRGHEYRVSDVRFSPNGKTLASVSWDGSVRFWDIENRTPFGLTLYGHEAPVDSLSMSADGKTLASGAKDKTIRIWDVASGKLLGEPLGEHLGFVRVAFSPTSNIVASVNGYNVRFWNVSTGELLGESIQKHEKLIWDIAFSPDGKRVATASSDKTMRLWEVATRTLIGQPLRGHEDWVFAVEFSPDGRTLASAGKDKTVRIWDVDNQERVEELRLEHAFPVFDVTFSPDGQTLASVAGQWLRFWDLETHTLIGESVRGHEQLVLSVAFSPDGKMLATAGADKYLRLWDVDSRSLLGDPLRGHTAPVVNVAFSVDGKKLASASWDKTIILWDLDFRERACLSAGRNLTRDEWRRYVGDYPYRVTCPNFPVPSQ